MRILGISNLYPNKLEPSRATYNKQQFKALSKKVPLKIIAPIAWTNRLRLQKINQKKIPKWEHLDGVEVFHPTYYFPPKMVRFSYGFFYFLSILRVSSMVFKTFRPDHILATWAYPDGFAAVLLGQLYRCPVYIKVHGSDVHSIEGWLRKKSTTWTLNRSRRVFSVSEDLKIQMINMGVSKDIIETVYNGIDHNLFYPQNIKITKKKLKIDLNSKTILFVGNLKPEKNVDVLINAYAKSRENEDIILYIIGDGPSRLTLEKKCQALGVTRSVCFLGNLQHNKIRAWMNAANLVILPSKNEGVPNVLLESMACGTHVVASDVGGIPEIIKDGINGILVKPGDVKGLSNAIMQGMKFPWDRSKIVAESKVYSWEKNSKIILKKMLDF